MSRWAAESARIAIVEQIERWVPMATVEHAYLDGENVAIEFSVQARPNCRFGFRFPIWDDEDSESLEGHASIAGINLQEGIEADDCGLPACEPGQIAWLEP